MYENDTKPGRNWKDSVQSIIAMGKFLARMRLNLDRQSMGKMARIDYNIDESTIDKLIKLSHHPILSDPQYFDKFPPQWGTLYEMKFLPPEMLLQKIETGETKYVTKYQIWQWRGVKIKAPLEHNPAENLSRMVKVPDGRNLIDYIRGGIAQEYEDEETGAVERIAKKLKVSTDTYRKIRTLIKLSEHPDLSEHDKKFVDALLTKIDRTRNVRPFFGEAKELIEKVWGVSRNKFVTDKSSQKRVGVFRNAIVILCDTCERVSEMEQPYMSAEDIDKSINELVEASKTIRKIAENLRRAKDE